MNTIQIINKVTIMAEAIFDYEEVIGLMMTDKREMKAEVEEYIDRMNYSGRLLNENYLRCKYFDGESGRMLILFLYRTEKMGLMQNWILKGICCAGDWSADAEAEGKIRVWLKSKITDSSDTEDWAVRIRTNQIIKETEKTVYENVLEEVRNAFDSERDKEAAEKLLSLQSIHFERKKRKFENKAGRFGRSGKRTRRRK